MASLLTKMFLKSEVLPDGRLRCIVPPSRPGMWQRPEERLLLVLVNHPFTQSFLDHVHLNDLSERSIFWLLISNNSFQV